MRGSVENLSRAGPPEKATTRVMRWSIVAPWLLTVGLFAALLRSAVVAGDHPEFGGAAESVALFGLIGLWGVADATVGAMIVSRRPDNRIGRILQIGGPLVISVFLAFLISDDRGLTAGPADRLAALAGWWASISILPAILIAWPLVAILFPDGRLPGQRWRWPVALVTAGEFAISGVAAIKVGPVTPGLPDNPFGLLRLPPEVEATLLLTGSLLLVLALGLAFTAIGVRWHRGDRLARAQLKWLLGALAVGGIIFPLGFGGDFSILDVLGVASATLVPIAIGVAVLRYRLYEIDRIISRTLGWALVTGMLGAVFVGLVVGLQALFAFVTTSNTLAVAASTLVVAALFQPLRRRIQTAVDRRFNRARYDAQRTTDAFADQLRHEVDLARLRVALVDTVDEAVRPVSATVWLRAGSGR